MLIKALLITLLAFSSTSFAETQLPADEILQKAISKNAGMSFTHKLKTYEIDNSYTREENGEEYLVIEYTGSFNLKKHFIGSSTFHGQPEMVNKSGAFAIVKRGSKWYF
jgi:hypothetical protein